MIFGSLFGLSTGLCIEDAGYLGAAGLQSIGLLAEAGEWAAVHAAVMLWQRDANSKIADIRQQLADRRMVMAEIALDHAKLVWAKEKAFVTETMAVPQYTPEYSQTFFVGDTVEKAWEYTDTSYDERAAKMGLTVNQCDDARVARAMGVAKTDLMANAMRVAEARTLHLNDRRFSRQLTVLGIGHNKLLTAVKIGELGQIGADAVRNAMLSAVNIGMGIYGYEDNRWRAGESGQWNGKINARTTLAPVETREVRDYRFIPDGIFEGMVFMREATPSIEQALVNKDAAGLEPL